MGDGGKVIDTGDKIGNRKFEKHDSVNRPSADSKLVQSLLFFMALTRISECGQTFKEAELADKVFVEFKRLIRLFLNLDSARHALLPSYDTFFNEIFNLDFQPTSYTEEQLVRISGAFPGKVKYYSSKNIKRKADDVRREVSSKFYQDSHYMLKFQLGLLL